jgi:hypothetical protein
LAAIERREWQLDKDDVKQIREALFGNGSEWSKVSDLQMLDLILSVVGVYAFRVERRLDIKVGMNSSSTKVEWIPHHVRRVTLAGLDEDEGYESPDPKQLALESLKK